jgi:hypothetical protein
METLQVLSSPVSQKARVLRINAWRKCDKGGDWLDWRTLPVGRIDVSVCDLPARALLKVMRDEGYLSAESAGRVAVEDDGYNVVIVQRSNNMPIYAIAYGELA